MGPHKSWGRGEDVFIQHAGSFIGHLGTHPSSVTLSKGGFGISDVEVVAPIAHCAAVVTSRTLFPTLIHMAWASVAADNENLAPSSTARAAMRSATLALLPVPRPQRTWSKLANDDLLAALMNMTDVIAYAYARG
ncbi:Hypothetical protein, putative [Bodo saltans]|uniref:Uncharacterized protein n=1 Tax=Bodo saltans TaxID=75058 RepID=A0A0S4JJQ4_BODSA|nr:Hypothetical protein, putative [Bodo saltans]|eukprot:CUG90385.1 Hypothetical protein, putative [Bodo saltans]